MTESTGNITILDIAEEVKEKILSWDFADSASVKMYPTENLGQQENGLVAIVKPADISNEMTTRTGGDLKYYLEIGFLKWIADDAESVDLLKKVEAFCKTLLFQILFDGTYVITKIESKVLYSISAYNRRKQFASIWTIEIQDMNYTS